MAEKSPFLFDGFGSFSLGINSGVAAQSLPPNQCAFAINTTFRGDFATDRPPTSKLNLTGVTIPVSLFQGATCYQPDSGSESMLIAMAGRLFQATPDTAGNAAVIEITNGTAVKSVTTQQNWLWQSENFVIWNDGESLPHFWDGNANFLRQSIGDTPLVYAIVPANPVYTAPVVGGSITVLLPSPPAFSFAQVVSVSNPGQPNDGTHYQASVGGGSSLTTLTNLYDTPGTLYVSGTQILYIPRNVGVCTANASSYIVSSSFNMFGVLHYIIQMNVVMDYVGGVTVGAKLNLGPNAPASNVRTINGTTLSFQWEGDINPGTPGNPAPPIPSYSIAAGQVVTFFNNNSPNSTAGVLAADFTAPQKGSSGQITLNSPYAGTDNASVWLGNGHYLITALPMNPNEIILTNLDDTSGANLNGVTLMTLPELPAGRMGSYGRGRNWMSLIDGLQFLGGDIEGGSSGAPAYNFRDAVLKVTENQLLLSGNFRVPGGAGLISAMIFPAMPDTSLGQGPLLIFTTQSIFSCDAPVDFSTWQSLTNPILTEILKGSGGSGQDSVVLANSDILFRSPDSRLRSLILSRLDYNRWGNTPISHEVERIIETEDSRLMPYCSGIEFDNRLLMASNPTETSFGNIWQGLIALNFDPLSSLQGKAQSVYDGQWNGLNILKLVRFKNVQRAFAICLNTTTNSIEIHEILATGDVHLDNGTDNISWSFETPLFFQNVKGKGLYDLIRLNNGELYLSNMLPNSTVTITVEYRPDYYINGWFNWHTFSVTTDATAGQYRTRVGLGSPKVADTIPFTKKPAREGRWFQFRISVTGHCAVMGGLFSGELVPQTEFQKPQ